MWYNSAASSSNTNTTPRGYSAVSYGGGATPRKTSSNAGSYRLTAAAAVAGSQYRYESYAATHDSSSLHNDAAPTYVSASQAYAARAATPNGRASPGLSRQKTVYNATPVRGYAHDDHREAQTVYRAPASTQQREFDPKVAHQQQQQSHSHSSRQMASSRTSATLVRQRAPSANIPSRSSAHPTRSSQHHHQQSSSIASEAAGGMAAFCTQVTQPSTTPSSKSSPPRHHGVSKRHADGSGGVQEAVEPTKKVPKYEEYANVRHPAHYFKETPLLPYVYPAHRNRHLLVLDLDETLVHASAQMPSSYDAQFNVDMETQIIKIYVKHRPFMMEFLRAASRMFEVCVFTASLSKYANQVLDNIDPHKELITHRLYREHCTEVDGSYTKDMAILGRPLENVLIVDNSPVAYMFFPNNAIPVTSWFEDESDCELRSLIPKLEIMAHSPTALQGLRRTQRRTML